jgi:hypothetical protein
VAETAKKSAGNINREYDIGVPFFGCVISVKRLKIDKLSL